MQFMMTEKALPPGAEVAVILGLHQSLGGPFKIVYVFRRLRCVHVYECVSQGRQWWFTLHLTSDNRFSLTELNQSIDRRKVSALIAVVFIILMIFQLSIYRPATSLDSVSVIFCVGIVTFSVIVSSQSFLCFACFACFACSAFGIRYNILTGGYEARAAPTQPA